MFAILTERSRFMKSLDEILNYVPEFSQLLTAMDSGRCPVAVSGLPLPNRVHFISGIFLRLKCPVVVVCAEESECRRIIQDLATLTEQKAVLLTGREFLFRDDITGSHQWEQGRMETLYAMKEGTATIVVATVEGLLQRTMPPEELSAHTVRIETGGQYDLSELGDQLAAMGYVRTDQVEGVGQFAVRGGILDVFSPGQENPVRVEFWDTDVNSMGLFDVFSQRRISVLDQTVILPASEVLPLRDKEGKWERLPDRMLPCRYQKLNTAADYLPGDAVICFSESGRVAEQAKNWLLHLKEEILELAENHVIENKHSAFFIDFNELMNILSEYPICFLDSFASSSVPLPPRTLLSVQGRQLSSFGISLETAVTDLAQFQHTGTATVVLVGNEQRALNLQTMLRNRKILSAVDFLLGTLPKPGEIKIAVGGLSSGFDYLGSGYAVLSEGRGETHQHMKKPKRKGTAGKLDSFTDLSVGDLVVHEKHGIGRFAGVVKMTVDKIPKDYLKLDYAGTDVLYLPVTQLDSISKYIGSGENQEEKKLSTLGGSDWERAKKRTRAAVKDLAKGLIQLYAQREKQPGFAFSPDTPWQREFEDDFPFEPTEDQIRCIEEIKRDMERARPMDRLLCGDVGYGKTEVAFRAIMKCIMDRKQAAILVPTTVLARQHYLTAISRFANVPAKIEMVSRLRTPTQVKKILEDLEDGKIDLLIGTHRLLQKDVKFKDLGLLVVDEEQRFGVTHKERLKEMCRQVDVLTLSATPIPRTLNMALSGIRDMSIIEEPPAGRQPVQTYVMEHDWTVLGDAMRRELARGGQVYYLHNRIDSIERTAAYVQNLLGPDVSVAVAHGRMEQRELNDVMTRMSDGEIDILICTTIIEAGIDIANVNTLIIEDADRLGLAQLHQIRGRVGRSARRAYAYMTYHAGKVLQEVAAKRLSAIREYAEFGSGFKIAMRDLEIRGAGNLLGPEQSGFIVSVGYDLYLKLLDEAVQEEKGEIPEKLRECSVDLAVAASIPDRYVPSLEQRMDLYRRIAHVQSEEDADDITDEMVDRFGDPPRSVNNLISISLLRKRAAEEMVVDISQKNTNLVFTLEKIDLEQISKITQVFPGRILFSPGDKSILTLKLRKGEDPLRSASKLVDAFRPSEGKSLA